MRTVYLTVLTTWAIEGHADSLQLQRQCEYSHLLRGWDCSCVPAATEEHWRRSMVVHTLVRCNYLVTWFIFKQW